MLVLVFLLFFVFVFQHSACVLIFVLEQIEVMDYDDIGRDELIGSTTIDLEDRWFDTRWQVTDLFR